jgi:hypothetical protein
MTTATIHQAVAATFEADSVPDVDQRVAGYWWGKPDDAVGWWLSLCSRVALHPIAQDLYLAHVADDTRHNRAIKDWAYEFAATAAVTPRAGQRKRRAVESYRLDWGRQAARDGVALALWPHLRECVAGINQQARRFGCRNDAYQYIREQVEGEAKSLIASFRSDMGMCYDNRFSRDFVSRWEEVTGADWYSAKRDG